MSTADPHEQLYAAREPVFPRRVSGRFRTLKWWLMAVLLGIYYITPWLRWDRGPALPDQAVLVDLANRRFFFFMIEIWPHEFYFVAGLLIMAGLGLFLFTSALGRVWCGYACPQTVWTDLFILVERWVEGDRNARIRLLRQRWDLEKIRKRLVKWALWLVIALATGGAWVFYFTDAPTLARQLATLSAPSIAYTTMAILTATTFAFGGFAREQICIYACPWPRIQAAMMDEDTLVVAYRTWRGEPRGKLRKAGEAPAAATAAAAAPAATAAAAAAPAASVSAQGDCIDCMACVNVCPMGIDIRNGQQLECITCALCIDACDEVMDRIGKPRGLIDYMALKDEVRERAGQAPTPLIRHILRPRTLLYFTLWSGIGAGLLVALLLRSPIDFNVTPVRQPVYVTLADGSIRNTYEVRLRNKQGAPVPFTLSVEAPGPVTLALEGVAEGTTVEVPADATRTQRVYVIAPAGSAMARADRTDLRISVQDETSPARVAREAVFNGTGAQ